MIGKAVVPIAGLGTRLYPLTKVIPKAMLPLPAGPGAAVPVVHWICAEAAAAGAEKVLLVVLPSQEEMVRRYLAAARGQQLPALPAEIDFAVQQAPEGFGAAVRQGADFIGDEPFLLLLGDHVYISAAAGRPCAAQVAEAFAKHGGVAMVGMQPVGADELPRVGVACGEPIENRVYRCTDFIEKPDLETAHERLVTPDLPAGEFLAHCGIYVFTSEIFDCLAGLSRQKRPAGAEIELAEAQSMLLKRHPKEYFLYRIDGRAYDTGTAANYAKAFAAFAR